MSSKTKILIGILVVIILGIGGYFYFIWTPINEGHCNSDSDCKFTCGCGCIPKNKTCPSYILCKPTVCGAACYCLNGKCTSWGDVYTEALKTKNIDLCKEIKNSTCRDYCLENLIKDETANWHTYKNEEYGFEVKYPLEWSYKVVSEEQVEFREKGKTYSVEESDIYAIGIFIYENPNNLTAEQIAEERKSKAGWSVEIKTLTVDNTDAAQTIDYLQQNTIIVKNKKIYHIVIPSNMDKSVHEVYDKMLSTFKFIESYTACGCGCCGGVEPTVTCLYHSKGDDIQKIIEDDKKAAQNSLCPQMGCSHPIKYTYCD
jgi:hypothetical protein